MAAVDVPPLAARAAALAAECRFERSSIPEVGRFLAVLAAGRKRLAEAGTGVGYGAAWLAAGMPADASLVTVEPDAALAAAAARLFESDSRVEVVHGDAREELPARAPFDLLFLDGGDWKQAPDDGVLNLLAPGGLVVLDDLTPNRPGRDLVREFWLRHPRMAAAEVMTTPATAAILAAKLS
jgi:predicted O-methyltransferase YrrM